MTAYICEALNLSLHISCSESQLRDLRLLIIVGTFEALNRNLTLA